MTDNGIIRPFLAIATDANRFRTIADVKKAILTVDTVVYTIGKEQVTDGRGSIYIIKSENLDIFGENFQLDSGLWAIEIPKKSGDFLGVIDTQEKGSEVLKRGMRTGYYVVSKFDTCFPNTIKPQVYQYGILEVFSETSITGLVMFKYYPHTYTYEFNNTSYKLTGTWNTTTEKIDINGLWVQENPSAIGSSTGSGTLVRFADGTMILTINRLNIASYVNGTQYSWGIQFADTPTCSYSTLNNGQSGNIQISSDIYGFRLYGVVQQTDQTIGITAIGRWRL